MNVSSFSYQKRMSLNIEVQLYLYKIDRGSVRESPSSDPNKWIHLHQSFPAKMSESTFKLCLSFSFPAKMSGSTFKLSLSLSFPAKMSGSIFLMINMIDPIGSMKLKPKKSDRSNQIHDPIKLTLICFFFTI